MEEKKNQNAPTPEQIEVWKKQHTAVYVLNVEGRKAYLHNPDRKTLSLAMKRYANGDMVGGSEAVLENCWLAGDEQIKTDNRLFMGAANQLADLIDAADATLEKL